MKKIIVIVSFVVLYSCTNSQKKEINNKMDLELSNKIIKEFYHDCNSKDFNKLNKISSATIDSTFLKKMILFKDSVNGQMIKFEINNLETIYVENKTKDSTYSKLEINSIVETFYRNGSYTERLSFTQENNSTKITGYHLKGNYR